MPRDSNLNRVIPNRLLRTIPRNEYERLLPKLENVALIFDTVIFEQRETIKHVYFPDSGVISLIGSDGNGSSLEIGLIGSEGMVGLPVFLQAKTSYSKAIVQGNGTAMRMKVRDFDTACRNGATLPKLLLRFAHSMFVQTSQSSICYGFHVVSERLARWILMMSDRMKTGEYQMTHEFLSNMLGVRREAVTKAAGLLQKKGLIRYSRGQLVIMDRLGLESAACKCYAIVHDEERSSL